VWLYLFNGTINMKLTKQDVTDEAVFNLFVKIAVQKCQRDCHDSLAAKEIKIHWKAMMTFVGWSALTRNIVFELLSEC
jgi:hypothetical protein